MMENSFENEHAESSGMQIMVIEDDDDGATDGKFGTKAGYLPVGNYLVLQVTLMVGLNTNDLKVVSALIVAVFLAFPYCRNNIRERIRCLKSEK